MVTWKKKKKSKYLLVHQIFKFVHKTILLYCLKFRKNYKVKNKSCKNKWKKVMFFLKKCAVFDSKKFRINKEQWASGLLSNLGSKKAFN